MLAPGDSNGSARLLLAVRRGEAARALGEAGRGASPTAGKREGISF